MEEADDILEEISLGDVQEVVDQMFGGDSFSFSGYVSSLMQGQMPFSLDSMWHTVLNGLAANLAQERKMYMYLLLIAVIGAVISNFTNLLQGKQVAEMAFYAVYLLFFSVLLSAFTQVSQIAGDTLASLLDFMKALSPAYFMAMAFSQGGAASGAYYEFTLVMLTMMEYILVKFALPAIHVYFMLCIANQFSDRDMFPKMAELIRDVIKFVLKTMFGVMMGFQVVQGMILPVAAKLEGSALLKVGSMIPGVGNTVNSVANIILCAGTLVKNAVGAAGVIVVALYCGVPLLRLVLERFLFQMTGAFIQPVSDPRIVSCITASVEAMKLLTTALFTGCLMLMLSIALVSAMTTMGGY